jgi:uncharacterized protein involved in outer membrane biogenesis
MGGLIAAILLSLIVVAFVPITVDLSEYKGAVESAATLALGRSVKIDDKIVISTSLQPHFSINGLRIENPKGFQSGDFLQMKKAKVGVRVIPLFSGKIHITEIKVKGLSVLLVENDKGAVNWATAMPAQSTSDAPSPAQTPSKKRKIKLESDSLVLTDVVLEDISVDYRRPGVIKPIQFKIEECTGAMRVGKPLTLAMKGSLLKVPHKTTIEIGSLKELLEENKSHMNITMETAINRLEFSGVIDLAQVSKSLAVKATFAGERLDSLNRFFNIDLPPLKSYRAGAQLNLRKKRADFSELNIQVGQSKLAGKMTIDNSGAIPKSTVELSAPLIQLNDFDVGNWSPEKGHSEQPVVKNEKKKESGTNALKAGLHSSAEEVEKLLSPELLGKFDLKMIVKVNKVLSGSDELGSGSLTTILKGGRFSIDPLKLNIPGGSLTLAASLKPDEKAPEASIRTVMKSFDFGVLVRRANPKAEMGGRINLDVDLKSSADSFEKFMAKSSGYIDFSGRLENLKAGVIDLWAVNLIAAVVSKEDENGSKINCVIGRWTMQNGLLKPDIFLIDTSKIRICGKGQVDFRKEHIDLKLAPTPKKPEYFSLATPIEIDGKFSEFDPDIQAGGLIGTTVRFIASPVTTTFKRLFDEDLPADGNDVCAMPIGPENRSAKPPAGCK